MAKKIETDAIKDIEAELNAVKNSLRALQQPAPAAPKPIADARAFKAKTQQAPSKSTLQAEVQRFLEQAEQQRLEQSAQMRQALEADRKKRQASLSTLKSECLQGKIGRLEWIKQMQRANQNSLRAFSLRFDEQCQHDRQMRLRAIDRIRQDLQTLLHG